MNIDNEILELQNRILTLETENKQLNRQMKDLQDENETYDKTIQNSMDSVSLIEKISMQKRVSIKTKIEKVVTEALKNIYGSEYAVHFDYDTKNNRTVAEMFLVKEDVKRSMDGFGGGVSDVICFPLKLLVLLSTGKCSKILIADEPGKHIDNIHVQKFFEFISFISKNMNTQIILCSHHQCAKDFADVKYDLHLNKGKTVSKKC